VAATDLDYRFGLLAQSNRWGPIVVSDDQMVPDAQVSVMVVRKEFLARSRDAVIRFAMAYLRAAKDLNAAAIDPGGHPEIVEALAQNIGANDPEPLRPTAPNWSYIAEDGVPRVSSIMEIQDFWSGKYFQLVEKKVSAQQIFDPAVAKDARTRLANQKPFGK
jgi:NitT/TauT family transport system substrate-binding protein